MTRDTVRKMFEYCDGNLINRCSRGRAKKGSIAGTTRSDGYCQVLVNGRFYLTHRLVWLLFHGRLPKELDHIDRDPSNNRIENLREVDRSTNMMNGSLRSDNTSGTKGVDRCNGKWRVRYKNKHLGLFDSLEEATKHRENKENNIEN